MWSVRRPRNPVVVRLSLQLIDSRTEMTTRTNWHSEHPPACTCAWCAEKRTVRGDRTKIGRNEKCPCGSGRKYKRCHGV